LHKTEKSLHKGKIIRPNLPATDPKNDEFLIYSKQRQTKKCLKLPPNFRSQFCCNCWWPARSENNSGFL